MAPHWSFVFSPLLIHSLFLILTIYGHVVWGNLNFLIISNSTPFYPIEMEFSPETKVFYAENYYQVFTISFLNFLPNAKFGHM